MSFENWVSRRRQEQSPQAFEQAEKLRGVDPDPEVFRCSGDMDCKICGHLYYDHPVYPGHEYLTVLCDGRVVKL